MRAARHILFLAAILGSAWGASIGDTYDRVIAEKGAPEGKIEAGSMVILRYRDATIKLKDGIVVSIQAAEGKKPSAPPTPTPSLSPEAQVAALKAELRKAVLRVQEIVNQPVTQLPRTRGMVVANFNDGWFHPGAETPDFNAVDVRPFQETKNYEANGYEYASSPSNPGIVFLTNELAFNSKTKFFYTDRSVPKKKLTDEEMSEINRLYRIIGRCSRELTALGATPSLDGN